MYRCPNNSAMPHQNGPTPLTSLLWLILLKLILRGSVTEPPVIPECKGVSHKVLPGESLCTIGAKYGVSVEQLLAENPQITDPGAIRAGQIICIPCLGTVYTVKPGDSLWTIALAFGIPLDKLIDANPQITDPDVVHPGQVICVPEISRKVSLTYLFGATSAQYLNMLAKTQGSINTVCPDYFDIDNNGNLILAGANKLNRPFLDALHEQGIRAVPFISNHFNRELGVTALNNRNRLSDQLAAAVKEYGLDGVDIDIENVTHEHRDMYTDFARLLREKLPADKIVSSAVAANPRGFTVGWHGSYDYKSLSKYCDYLMIMNYDEHYFGGPEGPISSSSFFEGSIQYALNQGVPEDKIVSGIPFFGRYWKQGESTSGVGLAGRDVEYLIANYTSSHYFDVATQSARAIVTIKPNEPEPEIWGGRKMTPGTYHIWYDSPEATRFKLETINKYGLLGAGSWALGQEILSIWDFYTQALNK